MNELTLLNYRVWNIYLLLLVSLLLLGCSYAGKPTFKKCQDVCDGLVGYYPFFGNANDLSGNGNDGNVSGATLTNDRDENVDSAYLFNGKDSYITFPTIKIHKSFTLSIIWVIEVVIMVSLLMFCQLEATKPLTIPIIEIIFITI